MKHGETINHIASVAPTLNIKHQFCWSWKYPEQIPMFEYRGKKHEKHDHVCLISCLRMCYHVSPEKEKVCCSNWFFHLKNHTFHHSFPTDSRQKLSGEALFCLAATKVASAAERGNHRGPATFTWKTQLPWYHGLWKSLNNSKIHQSLIRYISYHIFSLRYQILIFFGGEKEQQWEDFTAHHVQTHHIGSKMLPSSGHFLGQHVSIILSCNLWQPAVIVVCILILHMYTLL